jgi:hypothetical protein
MYRLLDRRILVEHRCPGLQALNSDKAPPWLRFRLVDRFLPADPLHRFRQLARPPHRDQPAQTRIRTFPS